MKGLFKQLHTHIEKIAHNDHEERDRKSKEKENIEQALYHKEQGNKCLLEGFIDEAIMHYTKSIYLNPENHIVYTNRATAFKKHKEFQHQYDDALVALTLCPKYFKAFLRFGEACIEVGKMPKYQDIQFIDKGIKNLQKALYLCWKLESNDANYSKREIFQKEIGQQILQAKKIKWFKEQQIRQNEQELVICQLDAVLSADPNAKIDEVDGVNEEDLFDDNLVNCDDEIANEREPSIRIGQPFSTNAQRSLQCDISEIQESNAPGRARGESEDVEFMRNLSTNSVSILKDVEETPKPDNSQLSQDILNRVQDFFQIQDKQNDLNTLDVPDYLLCRISDEMMDEPVIIQSGFTYEKEQIKKHFIVNGNFDPMTREEVNPTVLIPNRNIKQAAAEYLVQNPWAFEHIPGQKLSDLHM